LEADRREREERRAFEAEFEWMEEADHCLLGHGPHQVSCERFVADSETNGEMYFKAIEQRKPPEDQGRALEEAFMGGAVVIWNRT
jgi:hypothetical protein